MKIKLSAIVGIICLGLALIPRQSPTQAQDSSLTYREVMGTQFERRLGSVRWHPSENLVAVSFYRGPSVNHIYIYDISSPEPVSVLDTTDTQMAWSYDGQQFATVNEVIYKITLWDVETGEAQRSMSFEPLPNNSVYKSDGASLVWSPDSNYVGYIADYDIVCIWDLVTDEKIYLEVKLSDVTEYEYFDIQPDDSLTLIGMSWQPNNETLAVVTELGYVALFNGKTLDLVSALDLPTGLWLNFLTYSQDRVLDWHPTGDILAIARSHSDLSLDSSYSSGTIMLWDTNQLSFISSVGVGDDVISLAWSPDGTRLATANNDGVIQIWDVASNTLVLAIETPERTIETARYFMSIAWSHDGKYLASAEWSGLFRVFEIIEE